MAVITATPAVNRAIAAANTLPQLIAALPPEMAVQLEAKPLLASRTLWGTMLASLIGLGAAKYGIGLDTNTDQVLAGVAVLVITTVASAILRMMSKQPIVGIVSAPVVTPPAPVP